jgi:hypothetical protein
MLLTRSRMSMAVGLLLLCACRDPTQITLEISTDVPCGEGLDTAITVGELGVIETKPASATTSKCDPQTGRIGSLVAVPGGEGPSEVAFRIVSSVGSSLDGCVAPDYGDDCIVSRRALGYLASKKLLVPVVQRDACRGKPCTSETTCVDGYCVPARVDPERCIGNEGCGEGTLGTGGGGGGTADPDELVHGWSENFGGTQADTGNAIALTPDGHVHVAGSGRSSDLGGSVSTTIGDFIVRFADDGTPQDGTAFPDALPTFDMGLTVDALGNSYMVGSVRGSTEFGMGPMGTPDAQQVFVASFDDSLKPRWGRLYGVPLNAFNSATAVAVNPQGDVYVTGAVAATVNLVNGTSCSNAQCMFVLKLSATGGDWAKTFGTDATGTAIALDALGNIYVAGTATESIDFGNGAKPLLGQQDALLVSFDSDGNHRWDERFGGTNGLDFADAVVVDADGNVTLCGSTAGDIDLGGGVVNFGPVHSAYLTSFDSDGLHRWTSDALVKSATLERVAGMAVSPAGNFYLAMDSVGENKRSMVVASVDATGQERWTLPFAMDPSTNNAPRAIAVSDAGEVWVTGSFSDTLDLGGGTLTANGTLDLFLLKLIAAP